MDSTGKAATPNIYPSRDMTGNETFLLQKPVTQPPAGKHGMLRMSRPGPVMYSLLGANLLLLFITTGSVLMAFYYKSQDSISKLKYEKVSMDYENLNRTLGQIYVLESNKILIESLTNEIERLQESIHKNAKENNEYIKRLQLELGMMKSHPELLKSGMDEDLIVDNNENKGHPDESHIEKVLTRIKANITIKIRNSALFLAIDQMDKITVKLLVDRGANVNGRNNLSQTPLHRAALCNGKDVTIDIIKILIDNGADAFAKDKKGQIFLHNLVDDTSTFTPNQFHQMAEYLVSKNLSKLFNLPGDYFKIFDTPRWSYLYRLSTPFQIAVKNLEIANPTLTLLQTGGVNFNAVNSNDDSVLFYAMLGKRSTQMLSNLVKLGANWRHLNNYNSSLLHRSAVFSSVEELRFFIDLGLDVNAVNSYENTPLHVAVLWNNGNVLEMVRILIERGANLTIKDNYGHNALEMAMMRNTMINREEVVKLLKDSQN